MEQLNCIIMGAAGRDFHDFQTFFRSHPAFRVVAFTATQIPFIDARSFPRALAGDEYDSDIPIYHESKLPELIRDLDVDFVFLAYSDLSHEEVMHKASLVQSMGAGFTILGPKQTQLQSSLPVISITAVRTGAGKSPISQYLAKHLKSHGYKVGVIRHPMPYGDLLQQAVQRFASSADLNAQKCTVEEREEYEPYVDSGMVIFAGVDYAGVLAAAETESDVILWDGGNNDYSFIRPDLSIVIADALRPGHEFHFYPGESSFRSADVIVINKVGAASVEAIDEIREHARELNPTANIITSDLSVEVADDTLIRGRRVLVVEDGPTLTHGGMASGAGALAAERHGAAELIDPRPHAVGTIAEAFAKYPHLHKVLPALGYSNHQCQELAETINACAPDAVVDASPARLDRLLDVNPPLVRVTYKYQQVSGDPIENIVDKTVRATRC